MILTREQINAIFGDAGVPAPAWWGAESIQGDAFATVSREWVTRVWDAGIDSLRLNAPELVEVRQLGGGKTQLVPRYLARGNNCRNHALYIYSHGMMGLAQSAAQTASPLAYDALAFGFMHYTAEGRPDNLGRDGRHKQLWFVDHDGIFQSYEPGDGEENEMTPAEMASVTFLYAQ